METLSKVVPMAVVAFVLSSMLSMRLSLSVGQVLAPLRNYRLIVLALLANFVLMPFAACGVAKLLRLDEPLGIALLLLGTASGAPFLPLLARVSKGNLAVLPLFLEGVSVKPVKIGRPLVFLMMVPLAIGPLVKARLSKLAARVQPSLGRVSILSLALLIALLLITNMQNVLNLCGM